jgi:hypothetical protein
MLEGSSKRQNGREKTRFWMGIGKLAGAASSVYIVA